VTNPIAIVNSSAEIGGAELSLLPVVRELTQVRPVVAYLPASGPLETALRDAGATIASGFVLTGHIASASRQYGVQNLGHVLGAAALQQVRLARAIRSSRPAALYCNGFRAQLGATLPGVVANVPVVWHVRDFVPENMVGNTWKKLSRRTALVVANSSATAAQPALSTLRQPAVVIPNGIDLSLFRPRSTEPDRHSVVGMAAHLTAWKGHERFLRVLAAVRDHVPDVRGEIAGSAIYHTADQRRNHERLLAEITARGLRSACAITSVPPKRMPEWFARLSVLAHCPDRPEPFGRTLVEAMAVGVPVVAAAGGGADEVIGDAGVVCSIGDESAVVAGIVDLLRDASKRARLTEMGIARAHELFDERVYARRVAAAIISVASSPSLAGVTPSTVEEESSH
jgi:glycosyltransferase involved in cell wall biosynthesis